MISVLSIAVLVSGVTALPGLDKRNNNGATTFTPGATQTDVFPPTGTKANSALFPPESVVGYPGVTATGAEPFAVETATAYAYNNQPAADYPLSPTQPQNPSNASDDFSVFKQWGNLSPWYSVNSSFYGLPKASPLVPENQGCEITQVHYLYRHGARYPTSGSLPTTFASELVNATKAGTVNATGPLSFLNTWSYKLGAELLTPFGRLQNFELGVQARQYYGHLLNNFTAQGTLPVFRTQSQDRMVKTAQNFAAGFFGVPEFLDQVNIEIVIEASGFNNTGAPYEICTNSNVASRGQIGSAVASNYSKTAFASTANRLQQYITGFNISTTDVVAMLQLCSYETDALGSSAFCPLFTVEDFKNYEYYYDLSFYYNNGFGSPVAAAQGKGYLTEFISRFEQTRIQEYNSTTNSTFDSNSTYFPLNQSIYADATHEVVVLDTLTAFNLSAIFSSGPLLAGGRPSGQQSFVASQVVPFATHLVIQVMECSHYSPTKQMRFILNDAVLPIDKSYPGCPKDDYGLCSFDTVVSALIKREQEIDFQYDCFANYTATPGMDYNGRAPRS